MSSGSHKIHKVPKPFSVVNIRGPQVFKAVRRAEDGAIELCDEVVVDAVNKSRSIACNIGSFFLRKMLGTQHRPVGRAGP